MRHESVLTYIPVDRWHSLASGVPLPTRTHGTALFADISGFTPLTEALAHAYGARRGVEELTRTLNRVYDALTHEIYQYGGSIISFSGDAITCWFGDVGKQGEAAGRAVTAALALQQTMTAIQQVSLPNGEAVMLALKVAMATGPARRFVIGDPDIQLIDTLAGATLSRMADAEHQAGKGDVLIDVATADFLAENCQIAEWRSDPAAAEAKFAVVAGLRELAAPAAWLEMPADSVSPQQVRPYLTSVFHEREDETLTELRPAVALFLSFQGIDYDHDDAEGQLDAYLRWAQSVIELYGGTLMQLTIGDKGSYLYIAFGAPIAHEDNAERAAAAALDLMNHPAHLHYLQPAQIGLSQGIMRTGAYGGLARRTYGVLGDEVNLSARLMQRAAPGEILVSHRVGRQIAKTFSLEDQGTIRVKGKAEPINISRLIKRLDANARKASRRPLVGRTAELEQLLARFQPLLSGNPVGCIYVLGEPGIGKSHLLAEVQDRLLNSEGAHLTWQTFSTEQLVRPSLHPFMPYLVDYFFQELGETEQDKLALFDTSMDALIELLEDQYKDEMRLMSAELQEMRYFVGALLGLRWTGSPYENLDPKLRYERSLQAFNVLLCAESLRRPLIIHIQDAQWLDEESQLLLRMLMQSAAVYPLAILIDGRYRDDGSFIQLADERTLDTPVFRLDLNQLSAVGVRELAALVLAGEISDPLSAFLCQKANGNPFFTEQMALDLSERKALERLPDGSWTLGGDTSDELPVTINAVLIARLDRLMLQVRTIVQIASVLGQEFEVPVLTQMVKDDPEVKLKIKQAETETIWIAQTEWFYLFRHVLLRDAAYTMQLEERLRELHALAGWAIEQIHADDLEVSAPDIAYHFEKSGVYERAVIYLIKAAQNAAKLHANREAMDYYQRAIDLSEKVLLPPQQIAPIYEGLGDLHGIEGEYEKAAALYELALNYVEEERALWRTKLRRKTGQVLQKWGRFEEATQAFEAGLVELQADLDPEEACQLYAGLSMNNYHENKLDDALELATLALIMAQEDKPNLAQAHQNLAIIHWKLGDWAQALEHDTQSLQLWEELQNVNGLAAVFNNLGLLHHSMGDQEQALADYARSLTLFEQVGNQHGLACTYDNLGETYMARGEQEQAIECLEKAVSILARIGLNETEVFSGMWQSGSW